MKITLKKLDYTPPSMTEHKQLIKLVSFIEQNKSVFIMGPGGTGKTFLIHKAIPAIEEKLNLKCYYFDMQKEIKMGGRNVYKTVSNTITQKNIPSDIENVSSFLIKNLEQFVESPIVIFFDHYRATQQEFYDKFSKTCRKILSAEPNSSLKNIVMVFAGSLIQQDTLDLKTSPLWNVTEPIYILPHTRDEADMNNRIRIKELTGSYPDKKLLAFIYEYTSGHKFLSKTLIQVMHKYNLYYISETEILNQYFEFVWDILRLNKRYLDDSAQKIRMHFFNIIEYLETNAKVLTVILDLYLEQKPISVSPSKEMDQITITGIVNKEKNGQYLFSNRVYKILIEKLFKNYRAGDYCLFHAENDRLWKRAKDIFKDLHKKKIKREFERMISTKKQASAEIAYQFIKRLRKITEIPQFTSEFNEIITSMYDISKWSVFKLLNQPVLDNNFAHENQWDEKNENKAKQIFLKKLIDQESLIKHWSGEWEGVPIIIGSSFKRFFVYQLNPEQKGWGKIIPTFVQDAITLYYNLVEQAEIEKKIKRLKDSLLIQIFDKDIDIQEREQAYWDANKKIIESMGIKKFKLYEIFNNEEVRISFSEQNKLTEFKDKKKLSDPENFEINEFRNLYKYDFAGIIHSLMTSREKQLTGCNMEIPGNMMIIETEMSNDDFKDIKDKFIQYYKLIYIALEQNIQIHKIAMKYNTVQKTLNISKDFIYIVSKSKEIIFINERLTKLLEPKDNDLKPGENRRPIKELLIENKAIYNEIQIGKVLKKRSEQCEETIFTIDNKTKITDTSYIPLKDNDVVYAIAVIMQERTIRKKLLDLYEDLIEKNSIKEVEQIVLEKLINIGFDVVIQYKKDNNEPNSYISENIKGETKKDEYIYKIKDHEDTAKGKVVLWYRNGYPKDDAIDIWEKRLNESSFIMKEDHFWDEYTKARDKSPNFWITLPILCNNEIVKLYSVGWSNDKELDIETIYAGKMTLLQTFAKAVGTIIENITTQDYLKKFHAMLSHGLKEPLQIARMYLEPIAYENEEERKIMADIVDANLEMALTSLNSLLDIRRNKNDTKDKFEKIDLNDMLEQQTQIFRAYARKQSGITIDLCPPDKPLVYYTNKTMLIQILNNLVGNSIKYLKKATFTDRNKQLMIQLIENTENIIFQISDNGDGLPQDVIDYLNKPVLKNSHQIAISQFGIRFSRELALMMGGELKLMRSPILGTGTSYQLIFPKIKE